MVIFRHWYEDSSPDGSGIATHVEVEDFRGNEWKMHLTAFNLLEPGQIKR